MSSGSSGSSGSSDNPVNPPANQPIRWEYAGTKFQGALILSDDTSYHQWRSTAQVYLDQAEVWELVQGEELKPDIDPHNNWLRKNKAAKVILMQLVAPTLSGLVASSDTATQAWKSLEDKYDRKNVTSTFHTLNTCLSLTKDDTSMHAHISKFEEHFIRIEQKASIATDDSPAYLRGLKLFLSDSEAKAHLLLRTLPTSMSNIVDNL